MMPTAQQLAAALITVFEGPIRLAAFEDSGGVWTIGRGHTNGVKSGDTCTAAQAEAWFAADQSALWRLAALSDTSSPLAQAAYVSFGYNCGDGALLKVLLGQDTIMNPVHQTDRRNVVLPGLTARRTLEDMLVRCG